MAEAYEANTKPMLSHINVGIGTNVSILELTEMVVRMTGFHGRITTDPASSMGLPQPDGYKSAR